MFVEIIYLEILFQSTSTSFKSKDELYICKIITKKTKNNAITNPIKGVVPHPGPTFPYSEFNGRKIAPSFVLKTIISLSFLSLEA